MNIIIKKSLLAVPVALLLIAFTPSESMAQNRPAGGQKKAAPAKRPTNVSKPSTQQKKPTSAQKPANVSKPSNVQKPANVSKPSTQQKKPSNAQKSAAPSGKSGRDKAGVQNKAGDVKPGDRNVSGNKVNIDKSRGDVNINVDNSKDIKVRNTRNTSVRHNTYRPYSRPPYVYGGYRYRCYHPYYYHPYRPFVWGPVWHPWGFFLTTLAATAIIVSFADADLPPMLQMNEMWVYETGIAGGTNAYMRSGPNMYFDPPAKETIQAEEYYYDEGVFYLKENGGYTVVAAPVGGTIKTLPKGYETIVIDEATGVTNYYWGGTFYEKSSKGYKVVPPTSGAVVEHISDGGEEVKMGDITYVKFGETYFQPVQVNGKNMYEVADVEEDK